MRLPSFLARHSEFIGHIATLMSGKAAAALIAIFTMPIVSRLFTPSDFGVAALFVSIISIVSGIASMRYEMALVLPKEDREAVTIMALAYRLAFCVCAGVLLFVAIYEISGASLTVFELLGRWIWLLPVGILLMAAIHIQENWLTRTKSFKVASASLVVANVTTGGSRISFGALLGSSAGGLIVGHLLGMIARLAVQKAACREGLRAVGGHSSSPTIRDVARRYADFPKLNAPAGLIFTLGQRLPVLLFGIMFTPAVAGFYAMAFQLLQSPVSMVASTTRRVFKQKAASIKNQGRSLQKAFLLSTGVLALLGAPALVFLWFFGQSLLTWFLGERWSVAGRYVEIIAPWLFMLWVMAPCNPVFVVLREQLRWLTLQIGLTVLRLAVFGLAHTLSAGPEWTLHAFVLATVVGNIVTWFTAILLIRKHDAGPSNTGGDSSGGARQSTGTVGPRSDLGVVGNADS